MCKDIKTILIVCKKGNGRARDLARDISLWLGKKGIEGIVTQGGDAYEKVGMDPQFAIVLGGDGTILEVGRNFVGTNTIIFGINFGRVGFLTAACQDDWREILADALERPYNYRKCLALSWEHICDRQTRAGVAVNDLVLSHGPVARLVNLDIKIDDENLGLVRSDGLIFFSPLGSSGYNASAGGPILHPETDAFGMTAVCPFMTMLSPLVFPARTIFTVTLAVDSSECYMTVDGQENWPVSPGDILHVGAYVGGIRLWGSDKKYISRLVKY